MGSTETFGHYEQVQELAGRLYVPKTYPVQGQRSSVVDVLETAIVESGGRLIYSSFRDQQCAPMYFGAEDADGHRYGLLVYPFTTTRREIRNRPPDERRTQIRFGDPTREREESNVIGHDLAGVDVTLVLCVDPEEKFIVGLDPMIYEDLPMGISVYYKDRDVEAAEPHGWAVWSKTKSGGRRRDSWDRVETLVGFRPHRLLDYARFEAQASALGLSPGLRHRLAEQFVTPESEPHRLESFFGLDAPAILDIVESNFRLGVAVRGGVAEHHLESVLTVEPSIADVQQIDQDGQPDFKIVTSSGLELTIECKTSSPSPYASGINKVEIQKTRASSAGRRYTFDQFDIVAACLFPATGIWEYRFCRTTDLDPWDPDTTRIKPIQAIDDKWSSSIGEVLGGRSG